MESIIPLQNHVCITFLFAEAELIIFVKINKWKKKIPRLLTSISMHKYYQGDMYSYLLGITTNIVGMRRMLKIWRWPSVSNCECSGNVHWTLHVVIINISSEKMEITWISQRKLKFHIIICHRMGYIRMCYSSIIMQN